MRKPGEAPRRSTTLTFQRCNWLKDEVRSSDEIIGWRRCRGPELPPQVHRRLVGRDHDVELHRAKAEGSRLRLRVFTHRRCNASAARLRRHRVAAIGYMRTGARLIRLQHVRSDNRAILRAGDVRRERRLDPDGSHLRLRGVGSKGECVSARVGFAKDAPDARPVLIPKAADGKHGGHVRPAIARTREITGAILCRTRAASVVVALIICAVARNIRACRSNAPAQTSCCTALR